MKKKKIFFALLLAIGLPLTAYLIFYTYSSKAINLPPKYFPDTVLTVIRNGKRVKDTIWHSIKNFKLSNQLGKTVSWDDLTEKKVIVVDFIFTRCRFFCPRLTTNMQILQEAFVKQPNLIHFLSFTVDPEYDSIEVLKRYADEYHVNHEQWWMLTGSMNEIYNLAYNEFHVATEKNGEYDFVHTDKFILIDKQRRIRGYYSGQDSIAIKKLANDIVFLSLEKE